MDFKTGRYWQTEPPAGRGSGLSPVSRQIYHMRPRIFLQPRESVGHGDRQQHGSVLIMLSGGTEMRRQTGVQYPRHRCRQTRHVSSRSATCVVISGNAISLEPSLSFCISRDFFHLRITLETVHPCPLTCLVQDRSTSLLSVAPR